MRDSLVKIAVASPKSEVANVKFNIEECISAVVKAESEGAKILAFPELSVSSYTAGDLFFQSSFIDACETAVREYLDRTRDIDVLTMLGAPIKNAGKLYDCIITTLRGEILGISVKSSLSRDEERYFSRLSNQSVAISYAGQLADMSESLIFEHYDMPRVKQILLIENLIGKAHAFGIGKLSTHQNETACVGICKLQNLKNNKTVVYSNSVTNTQILY